SGIWVYWLDLTFKTEDGSTRNQSAQVANTIFDGYKVGSPVRVTYVRSKPDWFYVPGEEPTERDAGIMAGMHKYGAIASLLSAVGLVIWYFMSRGGSPAAAYQRFASSNAGPITDEFRDSAIRNVSVRPAFGSIHGTNPSRASAWTFMTNSCYFSS